MIARIQGPDLLSNRNVKDWYSLHSTGSDNSFRHFDCSHVLSVVNGSDEQLEDQMVCTDSGRVRKECDSIAHQCFAEADDEEFVKIS